MTIPTIHDDGSVENTIVACAGVVAAALGIQCDIEPIMPEGMGRYLLGHELAHCIDHRLRPPTDRPSLTDQAGFSIARTCAYYRRILLEELAACRLAGSLLDDETFDLLMSLDADPLEREIGLLQDSRMQFQTRQSRDLYTLAHNSAGCWWLVLIQFAKVFGHMVGAGRFQASVSYPRSIAATPMARASIDRLSGLICDRIMTYPEWPAEGWPELDDVWADLAASFGFRFEATAGGDALWLDDPGE